MKRTLSFVLLLCLGLAGRVAAANPPVLAIGAPLPEFALPGVDGKTYTPADFAKAKILVVLFTSNHCPTAQAYEGRVKQLVTDYAPKGVALVAINPNSAAAVRFDELGYTDLGDTLAEMKIRAEHAKFNFPYVDDGETQELSAKFGAIATPHIYIFDEARKLRFQGRIDNAEREDLAKQHDTRAALDALLAGRDPEIKTTRVFGCSLKWKDKIPDNERWMAKVRTEPVRLEKVDAAGLKALRANAGTGKLRLVNFWATWCGPCVSEFDDLVETNLRFRQRGFEMVTVAAEYPDQEAKVFKFLQEHHSSGRNLIFGSEDKDALIEAFDLDKEWGGGLPYTVLIGADGKILYRETGPVDFLALRRIIVPELEKLTPWVNRDKSYDR